jgi:two-component system nitrogen regulation response regulator GlnG
VLCYRNGSGSWALGAQCRLLLAGASYLVDCADARFQAELCERLTHLVHAETERREGERRLHDQMRALGMVGAGPGITAVFRWILRVSSLSDLPVLITGETGTGKELVARAIHALDPRRCHEPFVPVNCSAISAGVAESELFGHRRGAFTGADHDRKGLVRAARGGVLFLDEIGDLDLGLQGKLLRVLQEHRVLAVGDDHEVPVDVRVIAATNRNLDEMVQRQTLRADLFHRLNVLAIRLPALRERPEDIEPLVEHVIARCAGVAEGSVAASPEFLQALRRVDLPGNVRQLENIVRGALVARKHGAPLALSDLPPELWLQIADVPALPSDGAVPAETPPLPERAAETGRLDAAAAAWFDARAVLDASSWKLDGALDLCERKILKAALGMSSGNRSRAARLLGISPRSIFNKLRKHRLSA